VLPQGAPRAPTRAQWPPGSHCQTHQGGPHAQHQDLARTDDLPHARSGARPSGAGARVDRPVRVVSRTDRHAAAQDRGRSAAADPSRFQVKYGVNGAGSPGYRVVDRDVFHLNSSETPLLLPCDLNEFEFGIKAVSAAGSDPVYWNVTVKLFELKPNNSEHQI